MRPARIAAGFIALVLGAASQVSASTALAQTPTQAPAPAAADPEDGWRVDVKTEEQVSFIRPDAPAGKYARLWVRYEVADAQKEGYASAAILMEFDCAEGRVRARETTFYAKPARVEPIHKDAKGSGWEYPQPLSDEDRYRLFMCENGKPVPLAAFAPPALAPWPQLDPLDWTPGPRVADTDQLFFKEGPRAEYARLWVRVEYRQPFEGESATVYLYESDCKLSRVRQLQLSRYAGNNLQRQIDTDTTPTPWLFAPPGSFDEIVLSASCAGAGPPKTAV